ncbi:hypothetical protein PMAYCL1PPCAC_18038, partial [Pristionchus mayeri]
KAEATFGRYYRSKSCIHKMRRAMRRHSRVVENRTHRNHKFGRHEDALKFEDRLGEMERASYGPAVINSERAEMVVNEYLYQGDILLSEDQAETIFNETISTPGSRIPRQAYSSKSSLWDTTKPIYFQFYNVSASASSLIRSSLSFWQSQTCINFIESTTNTPRLRFIKGSGCWSLVGRSSVVPVQDISIGAGCEYIRTISHEIGHVLGLFHHQARPDRDNFVTVVAQNVKEQFLDQYNKQTNATCNTYGIGYDVGSVMHYKQREFTKAPGLITVLAKGNGYQNSLASHRWASFADVKIVNAHLCSASCNTSLTCENYGYPDPNDCQQCKCPSAFSGRTCGRWNPGNGLQAWNPSCGGELVATSTWTGLNISVGEDSSTVYSSISNCFWVVRVGLLLPFSIDHSSLEAPPGRTLDAWVTRAPSAVCTDACETQGLRVTVTTPETTGATYCCGTADPRQLTTTTNTLIFELYSFQGISDAWVFYRMTPQ